MVAHKNCLLTPMLFFSFQRNILLLVHHSTPTSTQVLVNLEVLWVETRASLRAVERTVIGTTVTGRIYQVNLPPNSPVMKTTRQKGVMVKSQVRIIYVLALCLIIHS